MSDRVKRWLEAIGLGEHVESFVENDIDFDLLSRLSSEDLKELGLSVGHRRRFLDAVANLKEVAAEGVGISSPSVPHGEAERRQLTVMFCDLVDSTELSQRLDAEDLREVNLAYQDACKVAIERYEGYVARYMGDGVLAYFGYPLAHEDDAERAIHAGLGVVHKISGLNKTVGNTQGVELGVRVGIATGPVVVGDLIGEGASQESAVVGETPNLAARLQALASRNAVVIGPGTHELVTGRFEIEDLGEHELKGLYKPVRAWRVVAPAAAESRFEAIHGTGLTPLVGREHEIGLLLERWEQTKEGDGQVVLLSGEAGIGKSRVAGALRERTAGDTPIRLRYQCSPYHTNSILHPVIEQMERAAHFTVADTRDKKIEKLESLLAQANPDLEAVVPLFASLLSIQPGQRYTPLDMTPERQKEETLHALITQLEGLASGHPLLLIFEDVHWADPTTLALLELVIERVQRIRVLAVITYRPEFSPPWSGHTHVTALTLNRFTRSLAMAMVAKVTEKASLPEEVRQQIVEKTDGIPLFVEELTKTILESDLRGEDSGRHSLSGGRSKTVIPATLHDSLTARLDRLAEGKRVAQAGSVIGREFSWQLLEIVCGLQPAKLSNALDELSDAGLVFRRGLGPDATYIFKHALVQEAAYESLLRSNRRGLHGRIAEGLLSQFPETTEAQPELLAHHFTEAGRADEAINYWLQAGSRAAEHAANREAIGHLTAGLAVLLESPESTARARRELDFQMELCGPYLATKGWGAEETAETFVRARELCTLLGETELLPPVLNGEYMRELSIGRFRAAREVAAELLRFGEQRHDAEAILQGHRILGWGALYLGEFSVSRTHIDEALRLYDPEQHGGLKLRYAYDARVAVLCARAISQCLCGYPDQANETTNEAIASARSIDHEPTLAYALILAGAFPAALLNNPQKAADFGEETLILSKRLSSPVWLGYGRVMCGWSACMHSLDDGCVQLFREGHESLKFSAPNPWQPFLLTLQAEIHTSRGETDRALRVLENALQLVDRTDERSWEALVHNLFGKTLLAQDSRNTQQAEASFSRGIEVAQIQGAKSLELRAATSLARLWQNQGKRDEARDLLAPVYDWFTEGFDTEDLKGAKTLLDQLT